MSKEYDMYKNKMNQNTEERRENTTTAQPKAKNPMDNSSSILYNKGSNKMENTGIMKPLPLRNFSSQWKQKNQDALKYAGDSTKESINKGLEEANSFMKDADEGTSFEKVQDASVKWRLAQDSNNPNLLKKAQHEMIGHLSKENKNTYLKNLLPLQDYIDAKDEFDYKNNNYTTTKNLNTTPDEDVRALQRKLNEKGYTDKFGNKLKEDGIYGGKTAFADDTYRAINNEYTVPTVYDPEDLEVVALGADGKPFKSHKFVSANGPTGEIKVASILGTDGKGVLESIHEVAPPPKTSDKGNLSAGDEKYNNIKQTMIKCLSANWKGLKSNKHSQEYIHKIAEEFRKYDDNSFNRAILLNQPSGAKELGHNAVMLLNKDNEGLVFSFYPTNGSFPEALYTDGEMRFTLLDEEEVNLFLYGKNPLTLYFITSNNTIVPETYSRFAYFDLPNGGYDMYRYAINLYDYPGMYKLLGRQCDDVATDILKIGGIDIKQSVNPNETYRNAKTQKWTTIYNKMEGMIER